MISLYDRAGKMYVGANITDPGEVEREREGGGAGRSYDMYKKIFVLFISTQDGCD